MGAFPSGQRGQTVNLLSLTSVVRIHPLPPEKSTCESKCFFQRNPPAAEEIHLRWMKSLRDEIPLCGEMEADFISSEAVGRRFHPSSARISSCEARFHYDFGGPNPPCPAFLLVGQGWQEKPEREGRWASFLAPTSFPSHAKPPCGLVCGPNPPGENERLSALRKCLRRTENNIKSSLHYHGSVLQYI